MDTLARIHAIDTAKFDGITLPRPEKSKDVALVQFDKYEAMYRKAKRRPEPVLEYLIRWVRRNVPSHRTKVSFLVCDVGQFMFDKGKLTAVLDLEMAYLGDSLQDLAALQLRDTAEPLGDIARALRHYEAIVGQSIDAAAFDWHTIAFAVVTPVSMTDNISRPLPMSGVLQYYEWWVNFCRIPLELIAASTGRRLAPPAPLIADVPQFGATAESLVGAIKALQVQDGFATHERAETAKLASFMARTGEFGPAIARQDIADVEALLGIRFESLQAAEAALEAFVMTAGPERDDQLIPLLYNRIQRQWQLLSPFISRPAVRNSLKTFSQLMAH
jgi:Phosphotransferase enzyme family